jgi:glycosyltransferase involved in cell wall biosynthesis
MNILLIDHYAGSPKYGMEYRPYYLAREWVKQGHRATIVAASYSHLRTQQPEVAGRTADEEIEGIQYHWYRTPSYRGNGLGRIKNMASFLRQIGLDGRRLARVYRPDVVIASSTYPMDIYPARRIARASSAKLVYEVHDLWPLSPVELGIISAWNPLAIVSQHAENYACRHADHIVSLLPKADAHFVEHGMAPHKFAWVPNGIDVEEWNAADVPLPAEHTQAVAGLRARGLFLIGYAGGHGATNALSYLIEAASRLQDLPVAFVLVGKGTHKQGLEERSQQLGLKNIVFLPPIPKGAIPGFLGAMDALYLGWNRQPVYRFGISPNKLVDYMMSAKPIIHAVEAGNDPVAESACGVSCLPEDPQLLAKAVQTMIDLSPTERTAMGHRGKDYVLRYHDYAVLANRFLQAIA